VTRPQRPRPAQAALSAALSGAVDLSALKARAEASRAPAANAAPPASGAGPAATRPPQSAPAPAPAGAGAGSGSPYVIDVTEASFQADVIERSMTVPVVLDLWAEWCEPCKQLSPVLERLADEGQGSWILAKIDVDSNQRIAQALQVQGIPAVKAILQGQIVAEFAGVQPEQELRGFLQALVQAAGGALPEGAGPPEDPRIEQAEDALAIEDYDGAIALYESVLAEQPGHPLAADALRQVRLMQRVGDADDETAGKAIAAADAAPDDVELQCTAADLEVAEGRFDSAFGRLLNVVRNSSDEPRDRARARLIELFAIVGDSEPAVSKARRGLASALF
jgi:putative thioredoxin